MNKPNFNKLLAYSIIILMYVLLTMNTVHTITIMNGECSRIVIINLLYYIIPISIFIANINIFLMNLWSRQGKWFIILKKQKYMRAAIFIHITSMMMIWTLFLALFIISLYKYSVIPIFNITINPMIASVIVNILLYTISIDIKGKFK